MINLQSHGNSFNYKQSQSYWNTYFMLVRCSKSWLVGGFNPSEKYESQLGLFFPLYGKSYHVPNHQPDEMMNPAIACSIAWLAGSRFSWQTKPWRIVMIWLAHLPSGDLLHSELEAMTQLDDFPRNLHLLMDFHSYVKYLNHQMFFFFIFAPLQRLLCLLRLAKVRSFPER